MTIDDDLRTYSVIARSEHPVQPGVQGGGSTEADPQLEEAGRDTSATRCGEHTPTPDSPFCSVACAEIFDMSLARQPTVEAPLTTETTVPVAVVAHAEVAATGTGSTAPSSRLSSLLLSPHADAEDLATSIRKFGTSTKLKLEKVDRHKTIEEILERHCKTRWRSALENKASWLVLSAPPDKGGFYLRMDLKISEVYRMLSHEEPHENSTLQLEYSLLSKDSPNWPTPVSPSCKAPAAPSPIEASAVEPAAAPPAQSATPACTGPAAPSPIVASAVDPAAAVVGNVVGNGGPTFEVTIEDLNGEPWSLLNRLRLGKYADAMMTFGFDDVEDLLRLGPDELNELMVLCEMSLGHR